MKSWKQWVLVISIVFVVLALTGFAGFKVLQTGTENLLSDNAGSEVIVDAKANAKNKGNENTVDAINSAGEAISEYHDNYNETLGWGGWQSVDWKAQEQSARIMIEELNHYIEKGGFPKVVEKDIRNVIQLANIAIKKQEEAMTLRKIHRILHDLDIAFNGYGGSEKIWGVTYTHNDDASEIEEYIDEHGVK